MKFYKSLIINLLAAGSLITGSAQAQDLLFTAKMGPKSQLPNYQTPSPFPTPGFGGVIYALGSQKETFGFLIQTAESIESPGYNLANFYGSFPLPPQFTNTNTVKIFSVDGKELQDLSGNFSNIFLPPNSEVNIDISPLEGGGFILETEVAEDKVAGTLGSRESTYYSRSGTNWVKTKQFPINTSAFFGVGASSTFSPPTGIFASFKYDGTNYVADVYATDKAALTSPALVPTITSDLRVLNLKRNKTILPYATKANVPVKDYFAKGLPPGLKINPVTGEISGKPTSKGSFSATIGATPLVGSPFSDNKIFRVK